MKHVLVLFLMFAWLSGLAQPYVPMLGNITQWRTITCDNGCSTDEYRATGDTLVDGQHYQILDGFHYIQRNFLIREDVAERKIYLKTLVAHTLLDEYPLYDFSLEDGDTTDVYNPISPLPENGGKFVLDSIVSRALEDGDHRFFYLHAVNPTLSQSSNTVWVEGVGSLTLINSPGAGPSATGHLGCAFKDGILLYAKLDSIGNCSPASTVELSSEPEFSVIPNLILERFKLKGNLNGQSIDLKVFSCDGRLVFQRSNIHSLESEFDASSLPTGLLLFVGETSFGHLFKLKAIKFK